MLEELAVRYHTSFLPALLLMLDVLIPKSVVVVVVVARDKRLVLDCIGSLDFVNSCVFSWHIVNHDLVCGSFELILVNILLLAHDTLSLLHSLIVLRTANDLLD